ncbi:hypothetical protein Lalb_Chr19g0135961 [Lupinus albus]|uniref:Uncharacterized protein n=1 Tax=Lupinus albus TaxID=3870 RepID=A0A6A4NHA5_LUPAL|nr:hypothetical protein Lalb_Chr19g0135961 [Lupinus albus]
MTSLSQVPLPFTIHPMTEITNEAIRMKMDVKKSTETRCENIITGTVVIPKASKRSILN